MKTKLKNLAMAATLALIPTINIHAQTASAPAGNAVPVTVDNFGRAESFVPQPSLRAAIGTFGRSRTLLAVLTNVSLSSADRISRSPPSKYTIALR
ncbi:MAG: hypothetical protein L0Z50_06715, partial [Verrucomicrobiales bacterium]|nr:hypothetical protein [Verrucomicrobiales bacterium]